MRFLTRSLLIALVVLTACGGAARRPLRVGGTVALNAWRVGNAAAAVALYGALLRYDSLVSWFEATRDRRREVVVAFALAQVGKPYRYAGVGPNAWDCSGLTMIAYRLVGVLMPHGSRAQGAMFPRVARDQLEPGDLVIYEADRGHVGMYVGRGLTVAATHTGSDVKLQPVFRAGYQFAVRPLAA